MTYCWVHWLTCSLSTITTRQSQQPKPKVSRGPYVARGCRGVRGTRGPWPAVGNTAGMVESNGQSSVGDGGRLAGVVCGSSRDPGASHTSSPPPLAELTTIHHFPRRSQDVRRPRRSYSIPATGVTENLVTRKYCRGIHIS